MSATLEQLLAHIQSQYGDRLMGMVLTEDLPLFGIDGVLDSLSILDLVLYLESRFEIVVRPHEMGEANFGTVARLGALVKAKTT